MKRPWGIRIRLIFMLLTLLFIPILIFAGVSQLRLNSSMEESLDSRVQAGLEKSLNCSKTQEICAIKHMICTNAQKNHYSLAVSNIVN